MFAPKIQTTIEAEVKFINRLVDERTCGIWHKQSLELALKSMRYEIADKSTSIRRKKTKHQVSSCILKQASFDLHKITLPTEEPITNMSGCWKPPKSNVIPGKRCSLNHPGCSDMYRVQIISPSITLQPKTSIQCSHQHGLPSIRRCLAELLNQVKRRRTAGSARCTHASYYNFPYLKQNKSTKPETLAVQRPQSYVSNT